MTEQEWKELTSNNTAAVIAPAGHGKTEMLAEIVERSSGRLLLLTHTNAGVDAIKNRIGNAITTVATTSDYSAIYNLIRIFEQKSEFKIYRKELYYEMLRSIKYSIEHNSTVYEGANHIRKDAHLQKQYSQFKFLSSRTLLSKGLEFDCVVIDTSDKLSVKDFYVAMTRAKKKIFIISPTCVV